MFHLIHPPIPDDTVCPHLQHNTELMNLEFMRKDQIYFADKKRSDGSSELYSVTDFVTKTTDNIRKGYLVGKYGATPNIEIEEVE